MIRACLNYNNFLCDFFHTYKHIAGNVLNNIISLQAARLTE